MKKDGKVAALVIFIKTTERSGYSFLLCMFAKKDFSGLRETESLPVLGDVPVRPLNWGKARFVAGVVPEMSDTETVEFIRQMTDDWHTLHSMVPKAELPEEVKQLLPTQA